MAAEVSGVRLMGDKDDVREVAELLALLPALTQGRVQLGEISAPYPNRRGGGVRVYIDAYVVRDPAAGTTTPGAPVRAVPHVKAPEVDR